MKDLDALLADQDSAPKDVLKILKGQLLQQDGVRIPGASFVCCRHIQGE